jgi:hypothetical protein
MSSDSSSTPPRDAAPHNAAPHNAAPQIPAPPATPKRPRRFGRGTRGILAATAAVVLLGVGIAVGAGAAGLMAPSVTMAPAVPVAIATMPEGDIVTVRGSVAEIFGNRFVLQDESGRALVDTGPAGEGRELVAADEAVTVQGRFDGGSLHAGFIVHADGRTEAIGPAAPRPPHPHGWLGRLGD